MKSSLIWLIFLFTAASAPALGYYFTNMNHEKLSCIAKLNVNDIENNKNAKGLYYLYIDFSNENEGFIIIEGSYIDNYDQKRINTVVDFSYKRQGEFYSIKKEPDETDENLPLFLTWETTKMKFSKVNNNYIISGPVNPIFFTCKKRERTKERFSFSTL